MTEHMDALESAREELKRVDHLLFVSLKYTRTVDIIKHVIERMLNCYGSMFEAMLMHMKEEKKIPDIPIAPVKKAEMIKKLYSHDQKMADTVDFYLLLRKIDRAEFSRAREYRRHVTMSVKIDEVPIDIDIDRINEYYKNIREIVNYAQDLIEGKKQEPEE
jgi:predicted GTPase